MAGPTGHSAEIMQDSIAEPLRHADHAPGKSEDRFVFPLPVVDGMAIQAIDAQIAIDHLHSRRRIVLGQRDAQRCQRDPTDSGGSGHAAIIADQRILKTCARTADITCMTCPSCGAAMRLEAEKQCMRCDYCGYIYFPEPNADGVRVFEDASPLACPVCSVPLLHAIISGEQIHYCGRCHGILIAVDSFIAVIHDLRSRHQTSADAAQQPDWTGLNRHIRCPQCSKEMDTHSYGGGGNVIIDTCERCSFNWLDHSELDRIVRAVDREYSSLT